MRPVRIELDGFQSYRSPTSVDLDDLDAAVILGPNRSGKTTLIEAIAWALFGKGRGTGADSVVSHSASRCRVALDFFVGHVMYRVERQRDRSGRGTSALTLQAIDWVGDDSVAPDPRPVGGDRIAETQIVIDELVGLTYDQWMTTSFIGQGQLQAFTRMRPGERKDLLSEVLELGVYERLAEGAREDWRRRDVAAGAARSIAEGWTNTATSLEGCHDELQQLRDTSDVVDRVIGRETREAETCRADLDGARAALSSAKVNATLWDDLVQAREQASAGTHLASVESLRGAHRNAEKEAAAAGSLAEQAQDGLARARDENASLERAAAVAESELRHAREHRSGLPGVGSCPTCGQPVDTATRATMLAEADRALDRAQEGYERAAERAVKASLAMADAQGAADEASQAERARQKFMGQALADLQERERSEAERTHAKRRVEALEARGARAPEPTSDLEVRIENLQVDLTEINRRLEETHARKVGLGREIGLAEAKVEQHERAVAEQASASLQASDHAEKARVAELAMKACGRDGIPARLIEAAVPEIEDRANELLAHLMPELTVTLESVRATKTAGLRETLDIVVVDAGEERPIDDLSGSERASVDLALRLGLSMMLAARAGAPLELLVIDEGFTAFDTEHRQVVPAILRRLAEVFPMVLFVTHEQVFADAFDTRILVARGADGGSTVQVERARRAA